MPSPFTAVIALPERFSLWSLGAMLCLPFLVPIHLAPIPSFHAEWLACILGLAAAPVLIFQGNKSIVFPRTAIALLALVAIALVQIGTGRLAYAETGLLVSLVLLWALLVMTIAATLKDRLGLLPVAEHLAGWLLAGALASAALGLVAQLSFLPGWAIPATMGGNLAQKNNYADYLFVGLASAAFLAERQRLAFPAFVGATLLLAQAAMISGSRAIFLYTGFLLVVWLYWRSPGYRQRMALLVGAVWLASLAAPYWPAVTPDSLPASRVEQQTIVGTGDSMRVGLYSLAWEAFRTAPWLGQGFGSFPSFSFFNADRTNVPGWVGMAEHAHNLFAQLLAEAGLPAATIVALMLSLWIWPVLRTRGNSALGWLAAVAGIPLIHAQLEYPLSYAFFLGILAVALGLGEERLRLIKISGGTVAAMAAGGILACALVMTDYTRMQRLSSQALRNISPTGARDFANNLLFLRKGSLIKPYVDRNFAALILPTAERLEDKIAVCRRILRFIPVDHAAYKCALVFALAGQEADAEHTWHLALQVYPNRWVTYRESLRNILNPEQIQPLEPLLERGPGWHTR